MQCVLLVFDLNCTREPFSLLLGSMAFLCSGDCRRQPTSSSRWDLKVLPVKESKAACPPFLTDRENAPGPWSAKPAGGRRSYPEEEMGKLRAPLASGRPTSLRALLPWWKSWRNEKHSLAKMHNVSSHLVSFFLKKIFNWQCSATKQNPLQESPEVALFFLYEKCQSTSYLPSVLPCLSTM